MGLFQRIFTWGKSEANAAIDKMENPVKMTEQGVRDLKNDLEKSMKAMAEIKAMAIRAKRESSEQKQIASDYEKKAMLLLTKGQNGKIEAPDADRLAGESLAKKEAALQIAVGQSKDQIKYEQMVSKMEVNVKKLRRKISNFENELQTLKARSKVASATKKLNKTMAQVDSNGTIAMLEKMKDRVSEDEALAESYGEIASNETSIDDEINKALESGGPSTLAASDSLKALKAKMGLNKKV